MSNGFSNGLKFTSCPTRPICALARSVSLSISYPNTDAVPLVLLTSPVMIPMIVVLPAPFGPSSAKKSPSGTSSDTPFSATVPLAYVFVRSLTVSAVCMGKTEYHSCAKDKSLGAGLGLPVARRRINIIGHSALCRCREFGNELFTLGFGRATSYPVPDHINLRRVRKREAPALCGSTQKRRTADVGLFQNRFRVRAATNSVLERIERHVHKPDRLHIQSVELVKIGFRNSQKCRVDLACERDHAMSQYRGAHELGNVLAGDTVLTQIL